MKILFVTSRFPYPPIKGDKAISYQRLKHFSKKHEITLLSFSNCTVTKENLKEISKYCKDIHIFSLKKLSAYLNIMINGFSNIPFQILYYKSKGFKERIDKLLSRNNYDIIHAFLIRIAPYISEYKGCPKIIEFIDSTELNMKRRASLEKGLKKLIFNEEAKRLSAYEKNIARKFDSVIVVSEIDKTVIGGDNIVVNPLGVDTQIFYPKDMKNKDMNLIIFTGNMEYFPNAQAVLYFVDSIFPLIQKKIPNAMFWVIGGGKSAKIKRLEKKNNRVRFLGYVNSMADFINTASVSVSPMNAGSGMQFKILEALACGIPVVASSIAKGDIKINEDEGLFVANEPSLFADKVIHIMKDKNLQEKVAQRAPQAVKDRYSWEKSNMVIEKIYQELFNEKSTRLITH